MNTVKDRRSVQTRRGKLTAVVLSSVLKAEVATPLLPGPSPLAPCLHPRALGVLPASRWPWWAAREALGALPHQESVLFSVFSKRASSRQSAGVIDAGGGGFSQSLASDLASQSAAAVPGTPPGRGQVLAGRSSWRVL